MKTPEARILETGGGDYYSGQDAAIWLGEGPEAIFLGHAVGLEYSLQEMVLPLFAYGDYTMRRRAHGMRIVHGSLSLMFQQTALMYMLLEELTGTVPPGTSNTSFVGEHVPALGSILQSASALKAVLGSIDPPKARHLLAGLSTQVKAAANPTDYAAHSSALRAAVNAKKAAWQTGAAKTSSAHAPLSKLQSQLQGRLSPLYSRFETAPEGFTITIDLGKPPTPTAPIRKPEDPFALPLSYAQAAEPMRAAAPGHTFTQRALGASPSWTTRRIIGVSLTGVQQVVDDSGRPLLENYSFLASDLI